MMREHVPCNGCVLCCKNQRILLFPDEGDVVESYETVPAVLSQFMDKGRLDGMRMLTHKPNGDCVYLGETGCTIWERAPAMCRAYDCRKQYLKYNRAQRRELVAKGHLDRDVMRAGRDRVHTLKETQHDEQRDKNRKPV